MRVNQFLVLLIFIVLMSTFACEDLTQTDKCHKEKTDKAYREGYIDHDHTFFANQTPETADKYCVTHMVLQYRWSNIDNAKTDIEPPVTPTFQAGFDYFTPIITRKGDSTNGYYWEAVVDTTDGWDNAHNPLVFFTTGTFLYRPNWPQVPIFISSTIEFKIYDPLKY